MKKGLIVGVLSAALLVGGATAAFGATDSVKLDEIKGLTQQMFGIQKQIVDKEVEAGLRTAEQADKVKEFIDKQRQAHEQALENGEAFGHGMGSKRMGDNFKKFNNGEPMTEEQIDSWSEGAEARLAAQLEAMESNGKLTEEQLKTWSDAAKAQLEVQKEALKSGTFIPGDMGKRGGLGGCVWGGQMAPSTSATDTNTSATANIQ